MTLSWPTSSEEMSDGPERAGINWWGASGADATGQPMSSAYHNSSRRDEL